MRIRRRGVEISCAKNRLICVPSFDTIRRQLSASLGRASFGLRAENELTNGIALRWSRASLRGEQQFFERET